jgi:hypothetical protein
MIGKRMVMNGILDNSLGGRMVFILSLMVVAAVAALAVQAVIGLAAAQVSTAQYCHFWCSEYGQCFWVCN